MNGRIRPWLAAPPRPSDGLAVAGVGLVVRVLVVLWAASRFPPIEDGRFYHVVATRIAAGLGYTWLWPDGAVTYAAHYPIGYPALIATAYAFVGPHPAAAMAVNALVGAVAVLAVHRVASTVASRGGALVASVALALHPGLVFYTPALMTEGVVGALLVVAGWSAVWSRDRSWVAWIPVGIVLGAATLVRPQCALLIPLYGWIGAGERARRFTAVAAVVGSCTVALSAPWVIRNCNRMNACVLSTNGGWNLFIGAAPGSSGTFAPIERLGVPAECRTVWDEAEKDACFGHAARREIARAPLAWALRAGGKLAFTFDYAGAAGWYLAASNPDAFSERAKLWLGVVETVWQRLVVLLGLAALGRAEGPRRGVRCGVALLSAACLFSRSAWVSHAGLVLAAALLGSRELRRAPPVALAAGVVLATAVSHAVFFGAGRYSLVCFAALAVLAGLAGPRRAEEEAEEGGQGEEEGVLTPGKSARDTEGS